MKYVLAWTERFRSMQAIPWLISAVTCLFGILTYARGARRERDRQRQKDEERYAITNESLLKINIKLDQITTTTIETKAEVKRLNEMQYEFDKRLTVVESKVQAAQTDILRLKGDQKNEMDYR